MKSLKIHNYKNKKLNKMESAVHFIADKINLGHIVAKSGKIFGANGKIFTIIGPKVIYKKKNFFLIIIIIIDNYKC